MGGGGGHNRLWIQDLKLRAGKDSGWAGGFRGIGSQHSGLGVLRSGLWLTGVPKSAKEVFTRTGGFVV